MLTLLLSMWTFGMLCRSVLSAGSTEADLAQLMNKLNTELLGSSKSDITPELLSALKGLNPDLLKAIADAKNATATTTGLSTTPDPNCKDLDPLCDYFVYKKTCNLPATKVYMNKNCFGSCSGCSPVIKVYAEKGVAAPCIDLDDTCASRKAAGECTADYMKFMCTQSCGNCP